MNTTVRAHVLQSVNQTLGKCLLLKMARVMLDLKKVWEKTETETSLGDNVADS